jgi:DNA-binding response OmpR family regulator
VSQQPTSILLVEDSRVQREIARLALQGIGYRVDAVESAEEALSCFAAGRYDVLMADIMLPGLSGVGLLGKVRQVDADQCVILMTAEGSGLSAMGAIRAGADDYVTKPIRMDDEGAALEVIVSRSLERRRLVRENRALQQQALEAERLHTVMSLAGAAAHEINQPLTVLIGTLELLLEDAQAPALREDLVSIQGAALRINDIVRKLGMITAYHTKPYTEDVIIVDLDKSSGSNA